MGVLVQLSSDDVPQVYYIIVRFLELQTGQMRKLAGMKADE